jgi:hypothetical protein
MCKNLKSLCVSICPTQGSTSLFDRTSQANQGYNGIVEANKPVHNIERRQGKVKPFDAVSPRAFIR